MDGHRVALKFSKENFSDRPRVGLFVLKGSVHDSVVRYGPLILLLVLAAIEDVRSRRVPNWISFTLILSGLALSLFPWRHIGFAQAMGGFGLGFGLGMLLYLMRAIGAGDVKLLAAVGAWLGAWPTLVIFALAAIVGMVMAVAMSFRQGRLQTVVQDGVLLGASLAQGTVPVMSATVITADQPADTEQTRQNARQGQPAQLRPLRGLPFAVAISGATLLVLASKFWYGK